MSGKNEEFAKKLYDVFGEVLACYEQSVEGLQKKNRHLLSEGVKYKTQLVQRAQIIREIEIELQKEREKSRALEAQVLEGQNDKS